MWQLSQLKGKEGGWGLNKSGGRNSVEDAQGVPSRAAIGGQMPHAQGQVFGGEGLPGSETSTEFCFELLNPRR